MQTITLQQPGKLTLSDMPSPQSPGPGEALVRVHRVGVCGTDYHAFAGKQPFFSYPRILGHELGVEILALGPDTAALGLKIGDRCSVEPYVNCQSCIACRRNRPNCCAKMQVIGVHTDGGMRESFLVPARKLHPANALSYEQIALVETLAIGAHAVDRAQVEAGENILVIGAGPIGLSVIEFAKSKVKAGDAGGKVIVMDVSEQRLAFVKNNLGVPDTIDARTDPLDALKQLTNNDMPTVVLDATGNATSMNSALKFLAPSGRLVFVGLFQGDFTLNDPEFHRRESTLLATRNALPQDFRRIISMLSANQIDTKPWITHRVKASSVIEAFPHLDRP